MAGVGVLAVGTYRAADLTEYGMEGKPQEEKLSFTQRQAEKRRQKMDGIILDAKEKTPYTKMDKNKETTLGKVVKNMTLDIR
jgi:hypothetical protein